MKRITYLAAAGALAATSGLGAWAANGATDDTPAAHVRTIARHGADDRIVRHHAPAAHEPGDNNGGVTSTPEPGDDNGGITNIPEPGDDNGGTNGTDDGGSGSVSGNDDGGHHGAGDDQSSDG